MTWIEITSPGASGKTVGELSHAHLASVVIAQVFKDGDMLPARSDTLLERGNYVRVVGSDRELQRFESRVGIGRPDFEEPPSDLASMQLAVSEESVAGRTLAELHVRERYGVTITRTASSQLFGEVPTSSTNLTTDIPVLLPGVPYDRVGSRSAELLISKWHAAVSGSVTSASPAANAGPRVPSGRSARRPPAADTTIRQCR